MSGRTGGTRRLALAALALLAAWAPPAAAAPVVQTQELVRLAGELESRDPRERRRAVQGLADLGSFQAWAIVLGRALPDREPMVGDEAQLQLGRLRGDRTLALLFGRQVLGDRSALLRLRAAEALGRIEARADAALWLGAIKERDARVRRALLGSLGEHAAAGRVTGDIDALARAVARTARSGKDAFVMGEALVALAALDPVTARKLTASFESADEPARRIAAFATWMTVDPASAFTHATAALDDEAPGLRSIAAEVLASVGTRAAAMELALRLEREPRARLVAGLVDALRGLSGLRHGADARPWRAWVEGLPEGWTASGDHRVHDADDEEPSGRTTTFAGHIVRSDRVAFLIDMSGSMWEEAGGSNRKARVEVELANALRALPEGARFNVIPYADEPAPFERGLVPADPRAVEKAITRFERTTLRGKGNAWGALEKALEDPEVDTLVLLTDGAPSGGERWNVELMARLWERENRLRRVRLDVVLVGARRSLVRHWTAMAADGGGQVVEVDL